MYHLTREATSKAMKESAEENLLVKKAQKPGKEWMTEAILELMEKRRVEKSRNNDEHQRLCREVK